MTLVIQGPAKVLSSTSYSTYPVSSPCCPHQSQSCCASALCGPLPAGRWVTSRPRVRGRWAAASTTQTVCPNVRVTRWRSKTLISGSETRQSACSRLEWRSVPLLIGSGHLPAQSGAGGRSLRLLAALLIVPDRGVRPPSPPWPKSSWRRRLERGVSRRRTWPNDSRVRAIPSPTGPWDAIGRELWVWRPTRCASGRSWPKNSGIIVSNSARSAGTGPSTIGNAYFSATSQRSRFSTAPIDRTIAFGHRIQVQFLLPPLSSSRRSWWCGAWCLTRDSVSSMSSRRRLQLTATITWTQSWKTPASPPSTEQPPAARFWSGAWSTTGRHAFSCRTARQLIAPLRPSGGAQRICRTSGGRRCGPATVQT